MTTANSKSDNLRAKIEASDAQLKRDEGLSATRAPGAGAPDKLSSLVAEYPGLAIAAGLGIGVLAGALLPRSAGRKLVRGGVLMASAAGEIGLAVGRQAMHKADEAAREGRELLGDTAAGAGRVASDAGRIAADAGRVAADAGRKAGASAQRFAAEASDKARDLGTGIAKKASEAASRLRH